MAHSNLARGRAAAKQPVVEGRAEGHEPPAGPACSARWQDPTGLRVAGCRWPMPTTARYVLTVSCRTASASWPR